DTCGSSARTAAASTHSVATPRRLNSSAAARRCCAASSWSAMSIVPVRRYGIAAPLSADTDVMNASYRSRLRTVSARSGLSVRAQTYGARMPADACVAPIPTGRSSRICTAAPRRASSYATAQPTIPAPTMTMSDEAAPIGLQLNAVLIPNLGPIVQYSTLCPRGVRAQEAYMSVASETVLSEPLLERCRERAPMYDRENRFCQEDFDELKAAGYLLMAVPKELGGLGFTLAQVGRETRRLAQY